MDMLSLSSLTSRAVAFGLKAQRGVLSASELRSFTAAKNEIAKLTSGFLKRSAVERDANLASMKKGAQTAS